MLGALVVKGRAYRACVNNISGILAAHGRVEENACIFYVFAHGDGADGSHILPLGCTLHGHEGVCLGLDLLSRGVRNSDMFMRDMMGTDTDEE